MSGYVTTDGAKLLLNVLTGQSTASKTLYLGLAISAPTAPNTTLANITEVTTSGYARTAIVWNSATADANSGVASVTNNGNTDFPAVAANMPSAGIAFLCDTQTGTVLSPPTLTKGTTTTSGGTFAAGTYYWVVTALNTHGETLASNEISATLVANGTQAMSWGAVTGATSYNIYRGTSAGGENVLVTNTSSTSYTATGATGTAASLPSLNTAANGNIYYVWDLAEPVAPISGKAVRVPDQGLVIE